MSALIQKATFLAWVVRCPQSHGAALIEMRTYAQVMHASLLCGKILGWNIDKLECAGTELTVRRQDPVARVSVDG